MYDAITLVAADRLAAIDGRKARVLLTDGVDTRSQLADTATALAAVDRADVTVYSSNERLDGVYREIRVTIDRPGHTVRARKGYRAPIVKR